MQSLILYKFEVLTAGLVLVSNLKQNLLHIFPALTEFNIIINVSSLMSEDKRIKEIQCWKWLERFNLLISEWINISSKSRRRIDFKMCQKCTDSRQLYRKKRISQTT